MIKTNQYTFHNRIDAGLCLAAKLKKYKNLHGIVMAQPRGGVPLAYVVARELGWPVEILHTKKIGHPDNCENAIGGASLNDYYALPHAGGPDDYIQQDLQRIRERLQFKCCWFTGNKSAENIKGRTVLVIDDGAATGGTLETAVHLLRRGNPDKIIVALPVASREAQAKLLKLADGLVVLQVPQQFQGVASFYGDFLQVAEPEMLFYLDRMNILKKAG